MNKGFNISSTDWTLLRTLFQHFAALFTKAHVPAWVHSDIGRLGVAYDAHPLLIGFAQAINLLEIVALTVLLNFFLDKLDLREVGCRSKVHKQVLGGAGEANQKWVAPACRSSFKTHF
jgi:hypothetical protein